MIPKRAFASAIAFVVLVTACLFGGLVAPEKAQAALSGSQFDPANIISDQNFFDADAMSQAQIQSFLSANVSSCQNSNCLASGRFDSVSRAADAMCSAYAGAAAETAAAIIFKVQQACSISAKVILVTLQKEQRLISDPAPTTSRIQIAMGYACPDTAGCDTTYYGFFNQVYSAAHQLKRYGNPPGTSNFFTWFAVGSPSAVAYHPNAACGAPTITIQNKATAALYYYTPYQPNAAALANLSGVGDGCSSYGNRNFWVYYNQWFGDPVQDTSPIGNIELMKAAPGAVRVSGWALDPDSTAPIAVHVYVGSVGVAVNADRPRPDVAAAYPGTGTAHGFDATVPVNQTGSQQVCLYAMNVGPGGTTVLGCQTLTLMGGSPIGSVGTAQVNADGTATISGWAIDPDVTTPIPVHIYVDGVGKAYTADKPRSDIAALYPDYGAAHGFQVILPLAPGPHSVCAYGINTGAGGNVLYGCQDVVLPGAIADLNRAPFGNVEGITTSGTTISTSGWAIDPDTSAPIQVHVYIDSVGAAYTASGYRPDVATLYRDYGPAHGFATQQTATVGPHTVCIYGINNGAGGHTLLACKQVVVQGSVTEQGRAPIGNLESLASDSSGTVSLSGWALDPDTVGSIPVRVSIDGAGTTITASGTRPDIAAAYPTYGAWHGFAANVTASSGTHNVCVYAVNTTASGDLLLGCKSVTVFVDLNRAPFGYVDGVKAVSGGVRVSGWAIDPDTGASIPVHVYVDATGTAYTANTQRPDVGAAYPGYGPLHGYDQTVPAAPGKHNVCVYAINTGAGGHTLLGCTQVLVN